MKIKSIKEDGKNNEESEYPCLMESNTSNGLVVLMTAKGRGTVVYSGLSARSVGYHDHGWSPHSFEVFTGTIKLSNE